MVNHDRYGGGGIYNTFCTFTAHSEWADYLFLHEFGHSFAGLADEYYSSSTAYNDFYPRGHEPVDANITALLDPETAGCRMPDAGCRMPDAGCRMPDAGCRMPDAGRSARRSRPLHPEVPGTFPSRRRIPARRAGDAQRAERRGAKSRTPERRRPSHLHRLGFAELCHLRPSNRRPGIFYGSRRCVSGARPRHRHDLNRGLRPWRKRWPRKFAEVPVSSHAIDSVNLGDERIGLQPTDCRPPERPSLFENGRLDISPRSSRTGRRGYGQRVRDPADAVRPHRRARQPTAFCRPSGTADAAAIPAPYPPRASVTPATTSCG